MQQRPNGLAAARQLAPAILVPVLLLIVSSIAGAASTVASSEIVITMAGSGRDTVEATFTLNDAALLEDGRVEHLLVHRPGAQVDLAGLALSGAASGEPEVERGEGVTRIRLAVAGEPATYTLRYEVTRQPGTYAVPVLAPNLPADESTANVTIRAAMPPGERLVGEFFPSISRREMQGDRQVAVYSTINVPAVVVAEHGKGGSRFTLSDGITIGALVLFVGIVAMWYSGRLGR